LRTDLLVRQAFALVIKEMSSDMTIAVLIKCIIGVTTATLATPTILYCFFPQVARAWFEGGADAVSSRG
jgi:hypothetical protein